MGKLKHNLLEHLSNEEIKEKIDLLTQRARWTYEEIDRNKIFAEIRKYQDAFKSKNNGNSYWPIHQIEE